MTQFKISNLGNTKLSQDRLLKPFSEPNQNHIKNHIKSPIKNPSQKSLLKIISKLSQKRFGRLFYAITESWDTPARQPK